ncbi:MAG: agmatinase family protein [Desulfamplus sp.]|nr:agmatinase family protein [Desulfamplus sp.]
MELSVSYKNGTALGPKAILEASDQLEGWDYSQQLSVIRDAGIYTALPIDCNSNDPIIILDHIEQAVTKSLSFNAIPVLLGGEHTVTLGALRAIKRYSTTPFGIIQIDAHADLRNTYHGNHLSHACVMHRAVDDLGIPLFQIGVRAISHEEVVFRKEKNIEFIDAKEIHINGVKSIVKYNSESTSEFSYKSAPASNVAYDFLPAGFPQKVYITLDVDGLDPSVIRATGTPVPGGISWYDTMILLENVIKTREVIGFDVVELAPIEGDHASDFAAAQLAYSVMGMVQRFKLGMRI